MRLPRLLIVGVVLFSAAGAIHFYVYRLTAHRWTVSEQPILLLEGFTSSQTFTVDIPMTYDVGIGVREVVPLEVIKTSERDFAGSFAVYAGETCIAGDELDGPMLGAGSMGDKFMFILGKFAAVPNQTYRLDLRIARSLPQLAATFPTAIVSVNFAANKPRYAKAALSDLLAHSLALAGLICALVTLWRFLRSRRRVLR